MSGGQIVFMTTLCIIQRHQNPQAQQNRLQYKRNKPSALPPRGSPHHLRVDDFDATKFLEALLGLYNIRNQYSVITIQLTLGNSLYITV